MNVQGTATGPLRFGVVEISFHWLTFALASGLMASGLIMTRMAPGSADQFGLYQLHKALGVTLLVLVVARIAWRLMRHPPPWPSAVPPLARAFARVVHATLYLCLIAVPLAGWALVSTSTFNVPTSLFGLGTWPHLPVLSDLDAAGRARIEPILARAHAILAYGLAGLVLLHSGAALWHGKAVLSRMVPGLTMRSEPR